MQKFKAMLYIIMSMLIILGIKTQVHAGISLEEAVKAGVLAHEGTAVIKQVNPTIMTNGKNKLKVYIRVINYGNVDAEYNLKITDSEIINDFETKVKVKASNKVPLSYTDVAIPVKTGTVEGKYTFKATLSCLSHPDISDRVETVELTVHTPDDEEIRSTQEALNDGTLVEYGISEAALKEYKKFIFWHKITKFFKSLG